MSEKSDRISVMQRTLDWSSQISLIAGPMQASDTRESWLVRAARKSGATFRQIKALYYGEVKDPKFSVAANILSAADKARIEEAKRNVANAETIVRARIAYLESSDPDFHRDQINALRTSLHLIGERDSA